MVARAGGRRTRSRRTPAATATGRTLAAATVALALAAVTALAPGTVRATGPDPDCSRATATPSSLWPPDRSWATVGIGGWDDGDPPPQVTIRSIAQDEPVGAGQHAPDASGVGTPFARLRAERDGSGDGRVYELGFIADFGRPGVCVGTVVVTVSHGPHLAALDSGARFDSTVADPSRPPGPPWNQPPTAVACWIGDTGERLCGPEPVMTEPDTVGRLDGTGSVDPEGRELDFEWSVAAAPAGSTAAISDPASPTPTVSLDIAGDYLICLVVVDHHRASSRESCLPVDVRAVPAVLVQLVWDSAADLDIHLLHPNGDWGAAPWDCHWANRAPNWGDPGSSHDDPFLDRDDVDGFGPENITLAVPEPGVSYRVGVAYFGGRVDVRTNATVRVLAHGRSVHETTVALAGSGSFWEAVAITVDGDRVTVTDLGTVTRP